MKSMKSFDESLWDYLHRKVPDSKTAKELFQGITRKLRSYYGDELYAQITICDACGKPIEEGQSNVGWEWNLHTQCVEHSGVGSFPLGGAS